jgi:acyl-CoA thioester hydrolase
VSQQQFAWPVRVYYEDTDAAGIVYHANYLRFMERARTEWLRSLGYEQDCLRDDYQLIFVITRCDIRYQRAVRFNAELRVVTTLERLRRVALEFEQRIEDIDGNTVCTARNVVACINAATFTPCRVPQPMMRVFESAR